MTLPAETIHAALKVIFAMVFCPVAVFTLQPGMSVCHCLVELRAQWQHTHDTGLEIGPPVFEHCVIWVDKFLTSIILLLGIL